MGGSIFAFGLTGMVAGFTLSPGHIVSAGIALFTAIAGLGMLGIGLSNLRETSALELEDRLARERREGARHEGLVAAARSNGRRKDRRTALFIATLAAVNVLAFAAALRFIPGPHEHLVGPERLATLYREAVAEAERAFGRKLAREVPLRIMSRNEMASHGYPSTAFAAYVPRDNLIAVVPVNVIWYRGDETCREVFMTPAHFRFLLMHEVVHALDDQHLGCVSGISGEGLVHEALVEGHAQHLAFRACERRGDGAWLKTYAALWEEAPEGDPKYKYWHAKRFFDRIAKLRPDLDAARIFRSPPPDPEGILDPEGYLANLRLEPPDAPTVFTLKPVKTVSSEAR